MPHHCQAWLKSCQNRLIVPLRSKAWPFCLLATRLSGTQAAPAAGKSAEALPVLR